MSDESSRRTNRGQLDGLGHWKMVLIYIGILVAVGFLLSLWKGTV